VLRQRSLYQVLMFGSFSLFWTAAPIELMTHYHLSRTAVAVFSLVGGDGRDVRAHRRVPRRRRPHASRHGVRARAGGNRKFASVLDVGNSRRRAAVPGPGRTRFGVLILRSRLNSFLR
jgi:hypothetical protein